MLCKSPVTMRSPPVSTHHAQYRCVVNAVQAPVTTRSSPVYSSRSIQVCDGCCAQYRYVTRPASPPYSDGKLDTMIPHLVSTPRSPPDPPRLPRDPSAQPHAHLHPGPSHHKLGITEPHHKTSGHHTRSLHTSLKPWDCTASKLW